MNSVAVMQKGMILCVFTIHWQLWLHAKLMVDHPFGFMFKLINVLYLNIKTKNGPLPVSSYVIFSAPKNYHAWTYQQMDSCYNWLEISLNQFNSAGKNYTTEIGEDHRRTIIIEFVCGATSYKT